MSHLCTAKLEIDISILAHNDEGVPVMTEQLTLPSGADSADGSGNERRDSGIDNMDVLDILNAKQNQSLSVQESFDTNLEITPPTPKLSEKLQGQFCRGAKLHPFSKVLSC